jgi:tRNA threonylcarbamoyladenosine biosynthesis protein TsaB
MDLTMVTLLAIETSTPACSVALLVGDLTFSRYSEEPRSHTRLIMRMIDEVLCEAGIAVDKLDAVAVTVGPGSFTGLRIGFSTVQGLAFGADLPVIPVSTLHVMAQTFKRRHSMELDSSQKIMSVLDARMGEFNIAVYQLDNSATFTAIIDDQLLSKHDAMKVSKSLHPNVIVGDVDALFEGTSTSDQPLKQLYPDAVDLVDIALAKFSRGEAMTVDQVDLVYLRGTEAWKKHTPLRSI